MLTWARILRLQTHSSRASERLTDLRDLRGDHASVMHGPAELLLHTTPRQAEPAPPTTPPQHCQDYPRSLLLSCRAPLAAAALLPPTDLLVDPGAMMMVLSPSGVLRMCDTAVV